MIAGLCEILEQNPFVNSLYFVSVSPCKSSESQRRMLRLSPNRIAKRAAGVYVLAGEARTSQLKKNCGEPGLKLGKNKDHIVASGGRGARREAGSGANGS